MNTIVIDVETKNTFQEVGSTDPSALEISFVGIYESLNGKYSGFYENQLKKLWKILKNADKIIGFNIKRFDLPILTKYVPPKTTYLSAIDIVDIYEEVRAVIKQERISLNRLAIPTLNMKKEGTGLDACRFYKNGELERLKEYCLQDVMITWELYCFGLKKRYVLLLHKNGSIVQIPVSWT